jgi:misacylated tRNA(Ala) deacylase
MVGDMSSTHGLYAEDAYLREFDAVVLAVDADGRRVALDRTAFFPGGGGQPHDLGTLAALPVESVARDGELIWHVLGGDGLLPSTCDAVEGQLDWDRRHALMRTHTALHVLSAVIWRDHQAKVTGASMEPLRGRMDFELEGLSAELVREIEARVNEEVAADRPVRVDFLPREEADRRPELIRTKVSLLPAAITVVRTVEIEGLDLQADGGTHVSRTGEIGTVAIPEYKSKGRLNKRLQLALSE